MGSRAYPTPTQDGSLINDFAKGEQMKIGVLGGGQLATMLTEAARKMGHSVTLLSRAGEPAIKAANRALTGDIRDVVALEELFRCVDVVTVESELLDVQAIRTIHAKYPLVRFLPSAAALEVSQCKLAQKKLLQRCGLNTADYRVLSGHVQPGELEHTSAELGGKVVLKWSTGGYDGRGVLPWRRGEDTSRALAFWARGVSQGVKVFVETHVEFGSEAAMVAVRHQSGEFASWPLMFTRQSDGTCREVYGPAVRMGLSETTQADAERAARAIGTALEFCGVFALEIFLTKRGFLVNEIAPRVHNSGHFTLHGNEESQFEAHIRAVTEAPLVQPSIDRLAYMRNVLGPPAEEFQVGATTIVPPPPMVALFWYGKQQSKPKRKMGHLTGRCDTVDALRELREQTCFWEQHFWSELRSTREDTSKWHA